MNNSNSLFDKQVPTLEELIEFVSQRFALKKNEETFHRQALATLILKFIFFFEGKEFWVRESTGSAFPWDDYETTLTSFLQDKRLWGNTIINNNLKQEHICVLFYIAALRYRKFPLPVLQVKYDKDNQSQNPHTDLFLFDGNENIKVAYAVQPRLLTKSDVESTGELKHSSYRSKEYLEKNLSTSQEVRQGGIELGRSFCYAMNNQGAKTRNFVVHIYPLKITWDDCGVYEETVTSQTLKSAQARPQTQIDPNENINNEGLFNPNSVQDRNVYPPQNSQSPPSSQNQASQDHHFRQNNLRSQATEPKIICARKNAKQSYLIIPQNCQNPNPIPHNIFPKQLKPSSSYSNYQKQKKSAKYSTEMNQSWKFFGEGNALIDGEERQVWHPILRRNGFK